MKDIPIETSDIVVPEKFLQKWQAVVDVLAQLVDVPAVLIMKADPPSLEVFRTSASRGNPYKVGERKDLDGAYCGEVLKKKKKLAIPNALKNEKLKKCPGVTLGMISYLGFPLLWPDGRVFGTICVLDKRGHAFSKVQEKLILQFKELVESHLQLLYNQKKVESVADKATSRLMESEMRYRTLFMGANDMIFLMDFDTFIECNRKTLMTFGCTKKEILGKRPYDPFSPPRQPDGRSSRDKALEKIRDAMAGEPQVFEWRHARYDGTPFDAEVSLAPIGIRGKKLLLAVVRDITERKKAEKRISEEKEKAHQFLDIAGVMIIVIDREGVVSLVNRKGCEFLGRSQKEIVGKDWFQSFLPQRFKKDVRSVFNAIMAGKTEAYEYYENPIVNAQGEERLIAWHNTYLKDEENSIVATLSSGEDITQRQRAAEMLRQQKEALEQKNAALREMVAQIEIEKSKIKNDVEANISDLLLPLLKKMRLKGASRKYTAILEQNLKNMASSFGIKITGREARLTPREVEICTMIKGGLTSKEISDLLTISCLTVSKHRRNIRKKLKISHNKVNLTSYLHEL
jgi:PAS domain S-box-containing protein